MGINAHGTIPGKHGKSAEALEKKEDAVRSCAKERVKESERAMTLESFDA